MDALLRHFLIPLLYNKFVEAEAVVAQLFAPQTGAFQSPGPLSGTLRSSAPPVGACMSPGPQNNVLQSLSGHPDD